MMSDLVLVPCVGAVVRVLQTGKQQQTPWCAASLCRNVVQRAVQGVGGLSHESFRGHRMLAAAAPAAANAVDGDLIELLLDLPSSDAQRVVDNVAEAQRLPLGETIKLVEDLQRLH